MPNKLSLVAMAEAVRSRDVSPLELVDAHLKQIEQVNPKLNAFVEVWADEARAAARQAETEEPRGPLYGVPLTVKDSFDVAGKPTLCGSKFRSGHRAAADSSPVARLRAAGAIFLGKTNTPEFLYNYETDNFITGRTNSAWDLERTPGGSSGGEAAAISSFCSPGGMGSDAGGSIREPAHFSGIAGLKPTPGRVACAGHFPSITHPGGLLGVGGPLARTVGDVKLLFETTAHYDPQDPFSAPVPLREGHVEGITIGFWEQFYNVPVQGPIRDAVRKAAGLLGDAGFAVAPFRPRGLERAPNVWAFFFSVLPARSIYAMIRGREQDAHWTGTEFMRQALERPEPTGQEVVENFAARDAMRAALLRQMDQYPVMLWPACGITAFRHRERRWPTATKEIGLFEAMMPLTPANLLGLPALMVPMGLSPEGLAVGVQLVGRPYEEERLLEVGIRLEEARGPFPAPPLAHV
ncbi:MAG TPA: amidase [Bryobacteraceae bacterium]|nr:amidase [Bryobacteraceae bacterium]